MKSEKEHTQDRLLRLRHLFLTETDENHYITMEELARRLKANKRTIADDISALEQAGLDIEKKSRPKLAYAVLSRDFTLEEIKLLLDCVQVSKLLSEKKTEELTKKLCALCSRNEAEQLKGQVHRNHVKSGNEGIIAILTRYTERLRKNCCCPSGIPNIYRQRNGRRATTGRFMLFLPAR